MTRTALLLFVMTSSLVGCMGPVGDEDGEVGVSKDELTSLNGTSLNGTSLNGTSLNGTSLNGVSLNGTGLNGVSLNGTSLNGVSLNGSTLISTTVPGSTLVGSLWNGTLSNGTTLPMRIDSTALLASPNQDVRTYNVAYHASSGWLPLCGNDTGGVPIAAVALSGTWNNGVGVVGGGAYTASSTSITFACRGKAIAKCVEMGYKPWLTAGLVPASRINLLQTCTRLLRNDVCGDGRAFTVDGTPVNIYDNVGIQSDTEAWKIEAEWTTDGARYTSGTPANSRISLTGLAAPSCYAGKVNALEGSVLHFATGTVLMNEFAH